MCNRYFNQVYSFDRVMYSTEGTKYEAIGFELVTDECMEGTIKLKERKTPDMRYSMQKLKIIWSKQNFSRFVEKGALIKHFPIFKDKLFSKVIKPFE